MTLERLAAGTARHRAVGRGAALRAGAENRAAADRAAAMRRVWRRWRAWAVLSRIRADSHHAGSPGARAKERFPVRRLAGLFGATPPSDAWPQMDPQRRQANRDCDGSAKPRLARARVAGLPVIVVRWTPGPVVDWHPAVNVAPAKNQDEQPLMTNSPVPDLDPANRAFLDAKSPQVLTCRPPALSLFRDETVNGRRSALPSIERYTSVCPSRGPSGHGSRQPRRRFRSQA